jgi:hypothetical protein
VYQVEIVQSERRVESVGLHKGEWVVRLIDDVDAHNVGEPGLGIPHSRASGTTKQV